VRDLSMVDSLFVFHLFNNVDFAFDVFFFHWLLNVMLLLL
jgi:hypothetical protein